MVEFAAKMPVDAYQVCVIGYGCAQPIYARSRSKALADTWRSPAFSGWTYKKFLQKAKAIRCAAHPRFGELIKVNGDIGIIVHVDSQYIKFVRPDSDIIYNTHPLDVEPPEARRGTRYYTAPPLKEK